MDTFTYYDPADGCVNGYLRDYVIDATGEALTTTYEYDCLGRVTRAIGEGTDTIVDFNALDHRGRNEGEVGCLGPDDYRRYVLPYMRQIFAGIQRGVPAINFATGNPVLDTALNSLHLGQAGVMADIRGLG